MASISNVSLQVANGSTSDTRNVTVKGTMGFDAGEVGKTFRLEIRLYGEDKSGDYLSDEDPVGDDQIYAFLWPGPIFPVAFRKITVASTGQQIFSETRSIKASTLDEDSGLHHVADADINTPAYMSRKDEVYARATLSTIPVTARSSTIVMGSGV